MDTSTRPRANGHTSVSPDARGLRIAPPIPAESAAAVTEALKQKPAPPVPDPREQFVERHFHELFGLILDAMRDDRGGSQLSLRLKVIEERIRTRLRAAWDDAMAETGR